MDLEPFGVCEFLGIVTLVESIKVLCRTTQQGVSQKDSIPCRAPLGTQEPLTFFQMILGESFWEIIGVSFCSFILYIIVVYPFSLEHSHKLQSPDATSN